MQAERTAKAMPTSADIAEHLPLVERIVAHFMRRLPRSVQREDLMAAGTLGLFDALRWSAHTCPEMFASYARIRIRVPTRVDACSAASPCVLTAPPRNSSPA